MNSQDTLNELESRIIIMIDKVNSFATLPKGSLEKKPKPDAWNALECLDHLNRYSAFYLPTFKTAIGNAKHGFEANYKPTWLGNKSAIDMLPIDDVAPKPMKTFKSKNPSLNGIGHDVINQFIQDQNEYLRLLAEARKVSLGKTKCKTTLPLIKFKLGDALRFVVYHEVRHVLQAQKATV